MGRVKIVGLICDKDPADQTRSSLLIGQRL